MCQYQRNHSTADPCWWYNKVEVDEERGEFELKTYKKLALNFAF